MGLLGLLEASSVGESAETREAAAEDRAGEGEAGAGSDKPAPAAVQVQPPRPVQRGRRVLQKGAAARELDSVCGIFDPGCVGRAAPDGG